MSLYVCLMFHPLQRLTYVCSICITVQLYIPTAGTNRVWQTLIDKQMGRWKEMITNFILKAGRRPVLLVRYEDLVANTTGELLRILEFLGVPYSPVKVTTSLKSKEFTQYYRNHSDNFEHYTAKQKAAINADISKITSELDKAGLAHTISLAQYIKL